LFLGGIGVGLPSPERKKGAAVLQNRATKMCMYVFKTFKNLLFFLSRKYKKYDCDQDLLMNLAKFY